MGTNFPGEKIVNGNWDGDPIWRRATAGESLAHMLFKEAQLKTKHVRVKDLSPYTEIVTIRHL